MPTRISIDESGFTGPDLTNALQPNFVVASTVLSDEIAEEIIRNTLPESQSTEYKFKNVWKSDRQKNALPKLCEKLIGNEENIYIWRIQKRFALFIKMIDYLIEPMFYASGMNFYEPWYAQSYCNTVYRDLTDSGTSLALYNNLTTSWNRLARYPTAENFVSLKGYIQTEIPHYSHPKSTILSNILKGLEFFEARNALNNFTNTNEIQVTSVLASVTHWSQAGFKNIEVAHDQSNNFFSHAEMWKTITSLDQPEVVHTLGNNTQVAFPLGVLKTESVDSKSHYAIQLADIMAGLAVKMVNSQEQGKLSELLLECIKSGFGEIKMSGSSPGETYVNAPPPKLVGKDALDKFTDVLFPNSN